jgi:hypothetical protein
MIKSDIFQVIQVGSELTIEHAQTETIETGLVVRADNTVSGYDEHTITVECKSGRYFIRQADCVCLMVGDFYSSLILY